MKQIVYLLSVVMIICAFSCDRKPTKMEEDVGAYSFFVAGHVYGFRWVDNKGFHPPFREKFDLINDRKAEIGVLLGDIVFECTEEDWDEVDSVLQYLDAATYMVVGNHDLDDRPLFESRYGRTYYSFMQRGDLFIMLDPYLDQWNISGDQLEFLKRELDERSDSARNIYVFFHQLLWWSKDNKYRNVTMNSKEERADTINFWTEVEPLFHALPNPVFMFAGDLGGGNWTKNYFYDRYDNITFVATGMGNDNEENFIIVHVDGSGKVGFELISLKGEDIHGLGKLEDYQLP